MSLLARETGHWELAPCHFGGTLGLCKLTLNYCSAISRRNRSENMACVGHTSRTVRNYRSCPATITHGLQWQLRCFLLMAVGQEYLHSSPAYCSYSGCRQTSAYAPTEACICVNTGGGGVVGGFFQIQI